jgi:hypothetical protein
MHRENPPFEEQLFGPPNQHQAKTLSQLPIQSPHDSQIPSQQQQRTETTSYR